MEWNSPSKRQSDLSRTGSVKNDNLWAFQRSIGWLLVCCVIRRLSVKGDRVTAPDLKRLLKPKCPTGSIRWLDRSLSPKGQRVSSEPYRWLRNNRIRLVIDRGSEYEQAIRDRKNIEPASECELAEGDKLKPD